MAKQNSEPDLHAQRAWDILDGTKVAAIGGRRFYNHERLGKCYAQVIGVTGKRSPEVRDDNLNVISGGQIVELVRVDLNDGSGQIVVEAVLSDDRKVGCTSLANDGDTSDAPNTKPHTEQPLVEQEVEAPSPNTNQQGSEPQFAEADMNRDGVVSPREQKQYDKGRR